MTNNAGETIVPIELAHVGDAAISTVFGRDYAWPIAKKVCEGISQVGSVYALYKFADDPTPAIRETEGTLIRIIRSSI